MAAARGYGLPCPQCGHLYSRVSETRGHVGRRPVIVRVRTCKRCGHPEESLETYRPASGRVRLPDPRRVLAEIRRDRYLLERSTET
jgi:transcriptional regulator NrdR family protein